MMLGSRLSRISGRASLQRWKSDQKQVLQYLSTPPYTIPNRPKVVSPPMVYISGEEMTRYTMELIMEKWIKPHIDVSKWEFYDLSCKARDDTDDKVLKDAVVAGKRICSIFKEPTITPSAAQVKSLGLKKAWGSPNGAMRRGWNGITISRDTIHIEGVKLGFDRPVLFERHAVGGEYSAGWKSVGAGRVVTTFFPDDGSSPSFCDDRVLKDDQNVVVTYHNPLDNVTDLAHHFFTRCLAANIVPYVVTKKTVFKWQEPFWAIMKDVFDKSYREKYMAAGIIPDGKLVHLISDAATMQIIRWTKGGFGMAAHNYDGDMLTDEIAQVHRSPGFITSNLIGKREDGVMIKEFEASHGTVADLWHMHLDGKETSMNPLGMIEALMGAMNHSASLLQASCGDKDPAAKKTADDLLLFTSDLRKALHNTFRYGQGTRDMSGPEGLTTERFIDKVAWRLGRYVALHYDDVEQPQIIVPARSNRRNYNVDTVKLKALFDEYDVDRDGSINLNELEAMLVKLGVAPLVDPLKRGSASSDRVSSAELSAAAVSGNAAK
jgi:isocitrate dehydrogenase